MLMAAEAALAYALGTSVCKQRENGKIEMIPMACISPMMMADRTNQVVLRASDMDEFIVADFSSVNGVRDVRVERSRGQFIVEVILSSFEREVRHKVYAKQRAFYREFPTLGFDFYVVDDSENTSENAVA